MHQGALEMGRAIGGKEMENELKITCSLRTAILSQSLAG